MLCTFDKKMLVQVWEALPGFGPENTLLLDNEARKFKDTPRNGVVVPEFGPAEVRSRKSDTLKELTRQGIPRHPSQSIVPVAHAYSGVPRLFIDFLL